MTDTKDESLKAYTVQDFVMKVNMKGKVLTALEIPAFEPLDHFRSFKITPRSQVSLQIVGPIANVWFVTLHHVM